MSTINDPEFIETKNEYINNNKRMSKINRYYSDKYDSQKKILKELAIFLFIIAIIIGLGKLFIPAYIVKYVVILLAVIAIIRAVTNSYDLTIRTNDDINQYVFDKGTKYVSTPEVDKLSKSNENSAISTPDNTPNWGDSSQVDTTTFYNKTFYDGSNYNRWCTGPRDIKLKNSCITATNVGAPAVPQYKECLKNPNCNDQLQKIYRHNFYDINATLWNRLIRRVHNTFTGSGTNRKKIIHDGNLRYFNNQSTEDYCGKVCSTNEAYAQLGCAVLCKGGKSGALHELHNNAAYKIDRCHPSSKMPTTRHALNHQSWRRTDRLGWETWLKSRRQNDAAMYGCGDVTQWNRVRDQNKLYKYCKLRCGYDMADCYKDKPIIYKKLPQIKAQCAQACSLKIPTHSIPRLHRRQQRDRRRRLIAPHQNERHNPSKYGVTTSSSRWQHYRHHY